MASDRTQRLLVSLVDDDISVRESLPDLILHLGFKVRAFASAAEFLASDSLLCTRCLLLDVAMPGMSGPELQRELARRGDSIPIVYITAHADDATRKRLIAGGAVNCLFKPIKETVLLGALNAAVASRTG